MSKRARDTIAVHECRQYRAQGEHRLQEGFAQSRLPDEAHQIPRISSVCRVSAMPWAVVSLVAMKGLVQRYTAEVVGRLSQRGLAPLADADI